MTAYTVGNQAELAMEIRNRTGIEEGLAKEFAARVSCGEIVKFTITTQVSVPQRDGTDYLLTQSSTNWLATADESWVLERLEA